MIKGLDKTRETAAREWIRSIQGTFERHDIYRKLRLHMGLDMVLVSWPADRRHREINNIAGRLLVSEKRLGNIEFIACAHVGHYDYGYWRVVSRA